MLNYENITKLANEHYDKFFTDMNSGINETSNDYDIDTYVDHMVDSVFMEKENYVERQAKENSIKQSIIDTAKSAYSKIFINDHKDTMPERDNEYAEDMAHYYFLTNKLNSLKANA
ncbi:MAG: hypothetical protein J6P61_02390 [Erysipelotrichaceae bacterium]|nr:hypothetical protein [Erysipelotrichaceae bacterium]